MVTRTLAMAVMVGGLAALSCAGGADTVSAPALDTPRASEATEAVSASVIVTQAGLSADGETVESITVRADEGEELLMRLGRASTAAFGDLRTCWATCRPARPSASRSV